MKRVLCISTGGTINKYYNPKNGELEVDTDSRAIKDIRAKWQSDFEIVSIIGKDSLEMNNSDRLLLLATINLSGYQDIIIVHGTDTMELTASYLADSELEKRIVLTGAMVPYAIDPTEASANIAAAYGYLQASDMSGIFIAMNGIIAEHREITKDRTAGKFIFRTGV